MEACGSVNAYVPNGVIGGEPVFTINLATGVTPFIRFFNGRVEHCSMLYNLKNWRTVKVTHANYRPKKEEFDKLPFESVYHVLNGGLLVAKLEEAIQLQFVNDPVKEDWSFEQFQEWCLEIYGKRLPKGSDSNGNSVEESDLIVKGK